MLSTLCNYTALTSSGVKRPDRMPWMFLMAYVISLRSCRSSYSLLLSSNGNRSKNMRLILAPPDSWSRLISLQGSTE